MNPSTSSLVGDLVLRPHHTALCVEDFDAARDFFVSVLGFEVEGEMDRRSEPGLSLVVALPDALIRWGMLVRDGYRLELFKYYNPPGRAHGPRQSDRGYTHFALEVSDVDAAYERLIAQGYRTTSAPQTLRGGKTRALYILAPEDNVVELIQFLQPAHVPNAASPSEAPQTPPP